MRACSNTRFVSEFDILEETIDDKFRQILRQKQKNVWQRGIRTGTKVVRTDKVKQIRVEMLYERVTYKKNNIIQG